MKAPVAQIEFRPKFTMQNPHVDALSRDGAGAIVGKAFREYPIRVVGYFAFQLEAPQNRHSDATAYAEGTCAGLRGIKVVAEYANLQMFVFLSVNIRGKKYRAKCVQKRNEACSG